MTISTSYLGGRLTLSQRCEDMLLGKLGGPLDILDHAAVRVLHLHHPACWDVLNVAHHGCTIQQELFLDVVDVLYDPRTKASANWF
jgi:hypothetical protein